MTEEVGEIARAYLREDVEGRPVDMCLRQEPAQLTAMCRRVLDDWTDEGNADVGSG
ncbi:MAG: hypothetical protein LBJ87_12705 [bacterium]|nr:hypothetical protein [bacterium]